MSEAAEVAIRHLMALRVKVEGQSTNYVGPDGRGGARLFQQETLRAIDRHIAAIKRADAMARGMRGV